MTPSAPPPSGWEPRGRGKESAARHDVDRKVTTDGRPWWRVLRQTVADMPITELAELLAHCGTRLSATDLYCPRCQSRWHDQLANSGAAWVDESDQSWSCGWCGASGSRWDLEQLVLRDEHARARLLDEDVSA